MKKASWIKKIKALCVEAGTYKTYFDPVIDTLGSILQERDNAYEQYKEDGERACIEYINSHGAKNLAKNPYLVVVNDLNSQALTFLRDLGLTPMGLKRIDKEAVQVKSSKGDLSINKLLDEMGF